VLAELDTSMQSNTIGDGPVIEGLGRINNKD
jgi:hypothetical protein